MQDLILAYGLSEIHDRIVDYLSDTYDWLVQSAKLIDINDDGAVYEVEWEKDDEEGNTYYETEKVTIPFADINEMFRSHLMED